jgi:hypothetical protein
MTLFRNLFVDDRNLLVQRSAATPPRDSSVASTLRKIGIPVYCRHRGKQNDGGWPHHFLGSGAWHLGIFERNLN